jgi:DeoR family fructose operon transcriptional repressor
MTTPVEAATERHRLIADRLDAIGRVEVGDLAARLAVAPETIRRDLRLLEQQGQLQRVHGGAVRKAEPPLSPFDGARTEHPEHQRRLADQLTARLPDVGTVFLGASLLTAAIADALARRGRAASGLTVVTADLDAAVVLSRADTVRVFNVGGTVDQSNRAQHGDWALSELRRFRTDLAVISASGVTTEEGVFAASTVQAAVTAVAIEHATRVWVVTDSSALGHTGFMRVASVHRVQHVYVSGRPEAAAVACFTDAGIEVTAAPVNVSSRGNRQNAKNTSRSTTEVVDLEVCCPATS